MIDPRIEIIDGYRICHVTTESAEALQAGLQRGEFDGLGLNRYRGFTGHTMELLAHRFSLKALMLPYADNIGFDGAVLATYPALEMLLLSEFTGAARFEGDALRVLRIRHNPRMSFGPLPGLKTLHIAALPAGMLREVAEKTPQVETVELVEGSLADLDGLENWRQLRSAGLWHLKKLRSVAQLAACPNLETLSLESVKQIADLPETLARLRALRWLSLIACAPLENFDFLAAVKLEGFVCTRTKVANREHPALARIKRVHIK